LFENQVARTPEAVAIVFDDSQVTYWELNELANRLAHHLQKLEVRPETLVGLYLEQSVEMVVGLLGILKAGCAYVPLDPEYPTERLEFMLRDTALQVLVTQSALSQRLSNPGQVVYLDGDRKIVEKGADRNPVSLTQAKNLAYVMYTSGSTGQPKGVCVTHRAVIRLVRGTSYAKFSSEEVFLQLAPLGFDASTFEIWGALLHGARLVVLTAQQPTLDEIGEAIRLYQITSLWLTAVVFHIMVSERIEALKPLRQLLAGGDVLSLSHVETARRELNGCRLINGYGPTEGTTFSCCYEVPLEDALGDTVPIGRPISNTTIYILDAHQQPVPIGVRGELYIGGDGLARGYWNRPELTADKFVPHPFTNQSGARLYQTGDWARYRPDGHIEFLGRMDNQVKIRGYRIELSEIEATLEQQESVRQAIVLARETALGDKQLVAYVIPAKKGAPANEELRAKLAARLPDYMIPNLYVLLEAFPLTPNGKVDRKALPPPVWKKRGRTGTTVTPRTHTEKKLAEIWCQLLGLEEVTIHDHFFALGGHSLLAMRLSTRIHLVLGVNFPISEIFEAPTLESLAKRIEALPIGSDPLPLLPLTEQVSQTASPASYAQERMWFLQQSTPTSAVYNQSFVLRVRGNLQVEALQCSLQALEERHEPLRTTFALAVDRVEQHVQPASEFPLRLEDLRPLPPVEREGRWRTMASQEASRLFDLSRGPLWRCRLFRLSGTEHVLLLTFHHICMDEWSLGTFRRELSKLYAGLAAERVVKLTPLACRYIDYAQWQRQWMESEVAKNQLEYWRTKLGSKLSALNLPTDYPRLSVPNERGATERRLLSPSLLKRLKKLSGENEMTLFMTLLGAFQVLLCRYTGQDDVVVGTPIANRDSSKFQGLVGLFLNTIVMRCDLSGQPTVREMLLRVRKMTLEAFAHRDVPFEKVVQTVRELREGNTAPLFQVMFVLKNLEEHAMPLGPLETTLSTVSTGTAKFDLTLFLEAKTEGLQAVMEYRTDLFEAETIQWMLRNRRLQSYPC
jgi:amino acid adenylation domain-containing protein